MKSPHYENKQPERSISLNPLNVQRKSKGKPENVVQLLASNERKTSMDMERRNEDYIKREFSPPGKKFVNYSFNF